MAQKIFQTPFVLPKTSLIFNYVLISYLSMASTIKAHCFHIFQLGWESDYIFSPLSPYYNLPLLFISLYDYIR